MLLNKKKVKQPRSCMTIGTPVAFGKYSIISAFIISLLTRIPAIMCSRTHARTHIPVASRTPFVGYVVWLGWGGGVFAAPPPSLISIVQGRNRWLYIVFVCFFFLYGVHRTAEIEKC